MYIYIYKRKQTIIDDMQAEQPVLPQWTFGTILIVPAISISSSGSEQLLQSGWIIISHLPTFSFNCKSYERLKTLALLLRLSFTLAFTSSFSCPHLPYLDYAAGCLSQLFCMQVALARFFVGKREGGRSCQGYWERITASHDGEEWKRWGCPVQ